VGCLRGALAPLHRIFPLPGKGGGLRGRLLPNIQGGKASSKILNPKHEALNKFKILITKP